MMIHEHLSMRSQQQADNDNPSGACLQALALAPHVGQDARPCFKNFLQSPFGVLY